MHFDTGLPWVDVEDDFSRARRRQVLARIAGWLRRRPDATRILSFDEVVADLGWRGQRYLGLRTIRLDAVTGTAGSRRDFDNRFRPTSDRVRQRWERLDLAQRRGAPIPPIDVYLIGGTYFVKDGHHRVSVAAATRQTAIDAYVTEVRTRIEHSAPSPSHPAPAPTTTSSAAAAKPATRPSASSPTAGPASCTPASGSSPTTKPGLAPPGTAAA
jgi:hypothetical protein